MDASSGARGLYGRCGFEDVGEMRLHVDDYEEERRFGVQKWISMVREPVGKGG